MAFGAAPGFGNLPQGNWSPVIFSQKVLTFFRTAAVAEAITNTDFSGDISDFGDTVRIIKEPLITVQTYKRGKELDIQALDDAELQMVIDQGFAYAFEVDDVERELSHINWDSLAQSSAGYALTDKFDEEVLQYMHDNATDATGFGSAGSPVVIGYGTTDAFTPLDAINRMARLLDDNDIPMEGRWFLGSPEYFEKLAVEDGKLIDASVTEDPESAIRSRKFVTSRMIHGFTLFKSTNNPLSSSSDVTIMAGHKSAVSTATAITKSETTRREKSFGTLYKGLLVYGRKVLRTEALLTGYISFS